MDNSKLQNPTIWIEHIHTIRPTCRNKKCDFIIWVAKEKMAIQSRINLDSWLKKKLVFLLDLGESHFIMPFQSYSNCPSNVPIWESDIAYFLKCLSDEVRTSLTENWFSPIKSLQKPSNIYLKIQANLKEKFSQFKHAIILINLTDESHRNDKLFLKIIVNGRKI